MRTSSVRPPSTSNTAPRWPDRRLAPVGRRAARGTLRSSDPGEGEPASPAHPVDGERRARVLPPAAKTGTCGRASTAASRRSPRRDAPTPRAGTAQPATAPHEPPQPRRATGHQPPSPHPPATGPPRSAPPSHQGTTLTSMSSSVHNLRSHNCSCPGGSDCHLGVLPDLSTSRPSQRVTQGRSALWRPTSSSGRACRRSPSRATRCSAGSQSRSMIVTFAWPPPSHIVCRP